MPQIDFSTYLGQICWLIFFFILTYLVVSNIFLPRMQSLKEKRNTYTQHLIHDAEDAGQKAKVIRDELNLILSAARTEAFNKRITAKSAAKSLIEVSCAKIESDAEKKFNKQIEKINRFKRELIVEAGDVGQELAIDILNQILHIKNIKTHKV